MPLLLIWQAPPLHDRTIRHACMFETLRTAAARSKTCLRLVDECVLIPLKLPAARLLPPCGPDGQVIGHQDESAQHTVAVSSIECAVSDKKTSRPGGSIAWSTRKHCRAFENGSALGLLLVVIAVYRCPRVSAECRAEGERSTACEICSSAGVVQQRLQISVGSRGTLSPCRSVHCLGAVTDASLACFHPSQLTPCSGTQGSPVAAL